jgi:flagella basal body P-ring formation protein FlgA
MILRILFLWLLALAPASGQCIPVSGSRILAQDMALGIPAFARISAELALGYAPAPGARRTYGAAELARLARRYGLALEPGVEACFVRPLETLTRERVAAALRAALPAARIQVIECGRQPVPPGELRFPVSGLQADPASISPLLWRGVVYAPGQSDFPVWAKVRITVTGERVTAREPLAVGRPISRDQLSVESIEGPPGLPDVSQIVGRAPRRLIPAGITVERQWLEDPLDVLRGERVRVEIRSGLARVVLEGQAQSSGRRGEVIGVRNPSNGKILHATIADRGHLILAARPGGGAAPERNIR